MNGDTLGETDPNEPRPDGPPAAPPPEAPAPPSSGQTRWAPVVVAVVAAFALGMLVEPIDRQTSHLLRGVLAGVAVAVVGARWWLGRVGASPSAMTGLWATLAALCTLGWFNYFQFDGKVLARINDYTDTAYYYTNSKYLAELGYDGLYAAALVCDQERGAPRTSHIGTIRDLRDDELRTRQEELVHGAEVKAGFTPERWAGFCHDIEYFLDRLDKKSLASNFFVDHGYNPPPTWSVVGGNLALAVDVERLKWICEADTVLVVAMFGVAWWVFGFEATAWIMLFYVVTFSGRWPILGMAIMRFDWVAALLVGLAMLRANRYGLAGASLAYAAMNRVFPAIYFWGWLVEAALDVWRERKLPRRHVVFAASAGAVTAGMLAVAAAEYSPQTLAASAYHLSLHNESFSSHRVGLGTVLVYRGEMSRADIDANGGMRTKELRVQSLKFLMRGLGVVALGLIAAYAWRMDRTGRRQAAWELVPLVLLPFWCALTPQVNYYNLRVVSFAWHGSKASDPLHATGLALLFATEIAPQIGQWMGVERHPVNAFTSYGLLVYFLVVGTWLGVRAVRGGRP